MYYIVSIKIVEGPNTASSKKASSGFALGCGMKGLTELNASQNPFVFGDVWSVPKYQRGG